MKKALLLLGVILGSLLSVVGTGTYAYLSDTEISVNNSLTAWVEETAKFFVTDDSSCPDKVFKYDESGTFVSTFDLPAGDMKPYGMAVVDNDVYVLTRKDKQVYHYTSSGELVEISRVLRDSAGGGLCHPSGLAVDGNDMWLVEESGSLCRYSLSAAFPDDGNPLNAAQEISLYYINDDASGLAIDDNYLYVLDGWFKRFFKYPRAGYPKGIPQEILSIESELEGSQQPMVNLNKTDSETGFVERLAPQQVDPQKSAVKKFAKLGLVSRELRQVNGKKLGQPTGAMLDDSSMWVVDKTKVKVFEYDVSQLFSGFGRINAEWEFDLEHDNHKPEGI
ncbi:MAG: hypothetical protein J7K77_04685 [Dehalococcoidales bacterium]|nr:hypothetical protein [Dehalococcoidales bacterium]